MQNTLNPKARSADLVIQALSGETLVYDMTAHEAHCLNETAAFVWSNCTGEVSIDEIAAAARQRFGQSVNTDFVELAVMQLDERKLLTHSGMAGIPKVSRREAIKKIGLASAVVLPVIASLVAPRNALGQVSCGCVSPGNCAAMPQCPSTVNCNGTGFCAP